MAESGKFSLKLLIDDKRNKVVLAEAEQDFVDVLISLLTLPMGKIARLLKNQTTVLGCYKNLNRSVDDMGSGHFETEAFKILLMYPKSTKDIHRKRPKMSMNMYIQFQMKYINPTEFFVCPSFFKSDLCGSRVYSNFKTSRCSCGSLMNAQIRISEEDQVGEVIGDAVFVYCRSSFIVTDDLKVTSNSFGALMNVLNDLGYVGFSDLRESKIDVGFIEMVTLLGCLFTSEAPLTCAFLRNTCMTRKKMPEMLSPPALNNGNVNPVRVCSVKVVVRKLEKEILYAECNEDFVGSLLSFLVHPLELACSLSNDNTILGCVRNLCRSPCRGAASNSCHLPDFYICSKNNLLDYTHQSTVYQCLIPHKCYSYSSCKVARYINRSLFKDGKVVSLYPIDPKTRSGTSGVGTGFMKRNTKFVVSDDLFITPMNSSSTIGMLKKMQLDISDVEEHQISITKAELISILKESLISSSALTKGLSNLLVKKPKEET